MAHTKNKKKDEDEGISHLPQQRAFHEYTSRDAGVRHRPDGDRGQELARGPFSLETPTPKSRTARSGCRRASPNTRWGTDDHKPKRPRKLCCTVREIASSSARRRSAASPSAAADVLQRRRAKVELRGPRQATARQRENQKKAEASVKSAGP